MCRKRRHLENAEFPVQIEPSARYYVLWVIEAVLDGKFEFFSLLNNNDALLIKYKKKQNTESYEKIKEVNERIIFTVKRTFWDFNFQMFPPSTEKL